MCLAVDHFQDLCTIVVEFGSTRCATDRMDAKCSGSSVSNPKACLIRSNWLPSVGKMRTCGIVSSPGTHKLLAQRKEVLHLCVRQENALC